MQFSCQLLFRREREFVEHFYACMRDLVPAVRELAPQHGRPLCDGLVRSVLWAALTQDTPEVVESTLRRVGAAHQRKGFPEAWYGPSRRALLDAAHELHRGEWGSLLSSHWVAYYTWLSASLASGSASARSGSGHYEPGFDTGATSMTGGSVDSLAGVLSELRSRHFPDNERALAAICTRVALRTGTDLRNPRPDQYADPAAVHNVRRILLVLGYSLPSFAPDSVLPGPDTSGRAMDAYDTTPPSDPTAAPIASAGSVPTEGPLRRWKRFFSKATR
ncbi:hypothetical protein KV205_29190 [Streptomyces sp. SKN60]|uniref:hypothetical protein n=1 Tax=Streptomyces sp. SKN60 TaxID=2855506 RepID=UPI00224779A4|nr:hypothetical protein [Streptomyces sp. SKN60]MCX2184578.1 hypothetical protein [Streptomyces sp. SKN60]